jgi:hypothetical protein
VNRDGEVLVGGLAVDPGNAVIGHREFAELLEIQNSSDQRCRTEYKQ